MNIPGIDLGLSEDIRMLRDTVQAFAAAEIAPRAITPVATKPGAPIPFRLEGAIYP